MNVESRHSLIKSFGFAFEGFKVAFLKGRNFRIQIGIFAITIIAGLILNIQHDEWLDIFLIASIVLILELINTSLESIVDIVSPQINPKAKIAKDVAAGAVLIASVISIVIGCFIFLPRIVSFIR